MNKITAARATLAVSALAFTACGTSTHSAVTPSDIKTALTAGVPKCSDIWKVGGTIPANYDGSCAEDSGDLYAGGAVECKKGPKIAQFDPNMWGYVGGPVHVSPGQTSADPAYGRAYWACLG